MAENQNVQVFKKVLSQPTKDTVESIIKAVKEGTVEPIYAGVVVKKFSKIEELLKKDKEVQELILADAKKHLEDKKKSFDYRGAKVTVGSVKTYWVFNKTNDPYLEALMKIQEQVKTLIKTREDELKSKVATWEARQEEQQRKGEFGVQPFTISWDELPSLEWEEAAGEVTTSPPFKVSTEGLKYSL